MTAVKYIAAGFLDDAERLLKSFVKENTLEFQPFGSKFRESNFSLIFMGREKEELIQFTQEIYQLTLGYLQSTSFTYQIGAIYLLYALYRNQVVEPFVRIRLILQQWEAIRKIFSLSLEHRYKSLHYVISFLYKNGFDFVACSTLHGPFSGKGKAEMEKPTFQAACMFKDVKSAMSDFLETNVLQDTMELTNKYEELKKLIFPTTDNLSSAHNLGKFVEQFESLVNGPSMATRGRPRKKDINDAADIGRRRAEIKAASFSRKAAYWQNSQTEAEEEEMAEPIKPSAPRRRVRRRRLPPQERRVGRPKKAKELEKLLSEINEQEEMAKPKTEVAEGGKKIRREAAGKMSYFEGHEMLPPGIKKRELEAEMRESSSSSEEEVQEEKEEKNEEEAQEEEEDEEEGVLVF